MSTTTTRAPRKADHSNRRPKLWHHKSGRWASRRKGRCFYFGRDEIAAEAAFAEWVRLLLNEGVDPDEAHVAAMRSIQPEESEPESEDAGTIPTVEYMTDAFLTDLEERPSEVTRRTYQFYRATCDKIVQHLGKRRRLEDLYVADLRHLRNKLGDGVSPYTWRNHVLNLRAVLRFADGLDLLPNPKILREVKVPSKELFKPHNKQNERKHGTKAFTRDELRAILAAAPPVLRAMTLCGVNLGYGASDLANLPSSAIDLQSGWATFERVKTSVDRRAKMWDVTVTAIEEAIALRPDPANSERDGDLVFRTTSGRKWVRTNKDGHPIDSIAAEFSKLLKRLKIKRKRVNFYALRHTLASVGDQVGDRVALKVMLGHADGSMTAGYVHELPSDARLEKISRHVHDWLFGDQRGGAE